MCRIYYNESSDVYGFLEISANANDYTSGSSDSLHRLGGVLFTTNNGQNPLKKATVLICTESDSYTGQGIPLNIGGQTSLGIANGLYVFAPSHFRDVIYNSSGTAISSDENMKNSITQLDTDSMIRFLSSLNPVAYKYNDGTSDRTHYGLTVQGVKKTLDDCNISTKDFAGYIVDANGEGYLRYDEFIAPVITGWQAHNDQILALEQRIKELEDKLNALP